MDENNRNSSQYKNIELGELIIMPNHFHGITVLDKIPETHSNASLRNANVK